MAVIKRVLCRERLRQVPLQFSWIDHRLVRDRHICRCSAEALALYLFLVTVADGKGLSYYSDQTISRLLPLAGPALARGRGPTESFCGTLTMRLKGRGMRWDKDNAEAMMAPGSLYYSNLWQNYWAKQRAA